jgi:hypothetical protein
VKNFSLLYRVHIGSEAHSAFYPTLYWVCFLADNAAGRRVDHSSPTNTDVKKTCDSGRTLVI